jgi:hypothetical protein
VNLRPPTTVNNFAAATSTATGSGWPLVLISCIRLNVFPPRRAGIDPLNDYSRPD